MNEKWKQILENLQKTLDSGVFRIWVAPLSAEVDANGLHVSAPNAFMAEWVKRHLKEALAKAAAPVLERPAEHVDIDIAIGRSQASRSPRSSSEILAAAMPKRPEAAQARLPIKTSAASGQSSWRYRFEDFVIGPSNSMAVAAARDMAQKGQVRTLFVNSASGLGKTHLAQAAGQAISLAGSPVKVAYLPAEEFAARFVAAVKAKELEDFRQYLCSLDVLLLEDVHFLQRKKAMQEMMLGVVKNLQDKGARVIFTSSFSPREMREMDGQLVSRFCSGILTSLERPDLEMRKEILRRKAKIFQVALPNEVCDLLSQKLSSDVRQLESCLRSMIFKARVLNSGLSVDLALDTLGQYAGVENTLNLKGIISLVCESFGLTESQLRSRSRKQDYVNGRNTVFYLARKHTELSLDAIGSAFNRRHSTVIRGITQMEKELASDSRNGRQFARAIDLIERKCGIANN